MGFDDQLQQSRIGRQRQYHRRRIYLDTARDNVRVGAAGLRLIVEAVSSPSVVATVRLNSDSAGTLQLIKTGRITTPYFCYYISNEKQEGQWIDLIEAAEFDYNMPGIIGRAAAKPAEIITSDAANTNTTGPDQPCTRAMLRSHPDNSGLIWLNFTAAAVQGSCWPLNIGDGMEVSLKDLNQINVNLEVANDKLTVIYEV